MCVANRPSPNDYIIIIFDIVYMAPNESNKITIRTVTRLTGAGLIAGAGATTSAAGANRVDTVVLNR